MTFHHLGDDLRVADEGGGQVGVPVVILVIVDAQPRTRVRKGNDGAFAAMEIPCLGIEETLLENVGAWRKRRLVNNQDVAFGF